jgi:hypothetical protein
VVPYRESNKGCPLRGVSVGPNGVSKCEVPLAGHPRGDNQGVPHEGGFTRAAIQRGFQSGSANGVPKGEYLSCCSPKGGLTSGSPRGSYKGGPQWWSPTAVPQVVSQGVSPQGGPPRVDPKGCTTRGSAKSCPSLGSIRWVPPRVVPIGSNPSEDPRVVSQGGYP